MNPIIIPLNYIERKPESDKYRIVGKGVTVEFLAQFINDPEWTMERICENYGLTPAEVHSAWAFYYDHRSEIDAHIATASAHDAANDEESLRQRQALEARRDAGIDDSG
ncbi:MAG: DUF433 domain-containing protein [Anaerolineae bacterium]|nr:DUF433 domain-containing protein [Anaerolineae bacterium]